MKYIVRSRTTGGRYLVARETGKKSYRWTKRTKNVAIKFNSYDAAQKASQRYDGVLVTVK
jgi:uncharacterized protein (DUF1330 family)